jgi:hypothetical protein
VWNVVTPYGNIVTLELTKNFFNPTITNGWNTLQQYHNFPTNVVVKFAYYGMNIFKVHEFRQVNIFSQLPAFHSRSLKRNEIKFFDIQLREGLTMRNKLVKSTILTLKYLLLVIIITYSFNNILMSLFLMSLCRSYLRTLVNTSNIMYVEL